MNFYKIDLLYRVFPGLYGLYVFHNSLYAGLYTGLYRFVWHVLTED